MRKLLTILGAISLTASAGSATAACTIKESFNFENAYKVNNINNLAIATAQASKSLALNSENGFDSDFISNNYLAPAVIEDTFENFETKEFNNSKRLRFNKVFKTYFNTISPINKNEITTDLNLDGGKKPSAGSLLDSIAGFSSVIEMIAKGNFFEGIVGLISKTEMIAKVLDPLLAKTIAGLLSKEILQSFGQAFDLGVYEGMTFQDVLQNGMNSLSNGMARIFLKDKNIEYAKIGVKNSKENTNLALENLTNVLLNFSSVDFQFDIAENLEAFAEIIHFGIILMVYINQFDQYRTHKVSNPAQLFVDGQKNLTTLKSVRNKKFEINDSLINIKQLVANCSFYLNPDEDDPNGYNFQRLISILFEGETNIFVRKSAGINWLVKPVIKVLEKLSPEISKFSGQTEHIFISLLNDMARQDNINDILNIISLIEGTLPDDMKAIIANIKADEAIKNNLYKEIYREDGIYRLGVIFGLNPSEDFGNLSIKNFLNNSTGILLDPAAKALEVSRYEVVSSNNVINLQTLGKMFNSLAQDEEWKDNNGKKVTTTVLEHALLDSKNFFEVLGFDPENKNFKENSSLSLLKKFLSEGLESFKEVDTIFRAASEKTVNKNNILLAEIQSSLITESWSFEIENSELFHDDLIKNFSIVLNHETEDKTFSYNISAKRINSGYFKIDSFLKRNS
ncbi:hypothetical protein SSABA_v1c08670 [Spiroplasma sabaudiense Ar-1343]|uniref:MOLPALP family lipoprotein n=1 Tax=Spiroplasma sabaudiense Ar-1343 TaxID=1276257 RepID=W6ABA2_9MOLU|nr:MOLPALP family lipoprotein [Spiroplasma sabaudiense]AHI54266.1 hypothetical protein SSABA_v1c08670 [Spiroplasma sabaudiense Ar-1343]